MAEFRVSPINLKAMKVYLGVSLRIKSCMFVGNKNISEEVVDVKNILK